MTAVENLSGDASAGRPEDAGRAYTCLTCETVWTENYCPTCMATIDRSELATGGEPGLAPAPPASPASPASESTRQHEDAATREGGNQGGLSPDIQAGRLFKEEDFLPYLIGSVVLGGGLIIPLLWGSLIEMDYETRIFWGVVSAAVFCASHSRTGQFFVGRYLFMTALVFLMALRVSLQSQRPSTGFFLAGGLLGMAVLAGSGWCGILLARQARRHQASSAVRSIDAASPLRAITDVLTADGLREQGLGELLELWERPMRDSSRSSLLAELEGRGYRSKALPAPPRLGDDA